MRNFLHWPLRRKPSGAGHLQPAIHAIDRLTDDSCRRFGLSTVLLRAHAAPPPCTVSFRQRTIARFANSILKALCFCGTAAFSAASAAARKVCAFAGAPMRTASASLERQGLCA